MAMAHEMEKKTCLRELSNLRLGEEDYTVYFFTRGRIKKIRD
jgi:hypothetical protein